MTKIRERLHRFDKKFFVRSLLLSLSVCLTYLFFTPGEIYLRNQKDFIVSARHTLLPMLLSALAVTAVAMLLLYLAEFIHPEVYDICADLTLGVLLASYVQELLLNRDLTALTGRDVLDDLSGKVLVVDLIIFIVIALLPLLGHFIKKFFPKWRLFQGDNGMVVLILSAAVIFMQAAGFASSAASFGFDTYKRRNDLGFAYAPTSSLSKEGNVIVFLVDRLDSHYMDEVLSTYPEVEGKLDGFTFYQNNIAHYTSTFPSITSMFTKEPYPAGEEWVDYFSRAWAKDNLCSALKDGGYQVNLLMDNPNIFTSQEEMTPLCDNQDYLNDITYNYFGRDGGVQIMMKLSAIKLLPYVAKKLVLDITPQDFSGAFLRFTDRDKSEFMPVSVSDESDLRFYDHLKNDPLRADSSKKTFSFIHLTGAHDPYASLEQLYPGERKEGSFEQMATLRGDLEILFLYFEQMRACGVFDNSTILILGDHGRAPKEIEIGEGDRLTSPIVTGLLIKPAHSTGKLLYDNVSELSNDYFAASVLEYAGLDHSAYGISYEDVISRGQVSPRDLCATRYWTLGSLEIIADYRVTGNARDFSNWEMLPREGEE